jgi:hypothetical protein
MLCFREYTDRLEVSVRIALHEAVGQFTPKKLPLEKGTASLEFHRKHALTQERPILIGNQHFFSQSKSVRYLVG